ncbi:helix-turn-helix domain-containing protein [Nocardia farcinica]|uniref:helix-turn-helix domain-containing protein n=1 Tax=Nocardia farcinica TaxID=37329 RepID=UPI0024581C92|nr:helix-turn-helix domain-containing protein [Nocardia farcinica]
MSWQASRWAARIARPSSGPEKCVLLVMAEIADEEGRGVRVSQRTLVERCSFSERTVRRALEGLVAQGLIRLGDQSLVLHLPAGQRPVVWDLVINGSAVAPDELTPATLTTHPGQSDPSPRSQRPPTLVSLTTHPGHSDRSTPVTLTGRPRSQ